MMGAFGIGLALTSAGATSDPNATFSFLANGYTQELWAVGDTFPVGVAFAPNGDVLTCYGGGHRYSASTTSVVHGSTIHAETTFASGCNGLGLTNHSNGAIYNNAYDGVRKLDANLGLVAGPFGPTGSSYGIATDPQTGDLVYVASDYTIQRVNAALTASSVFSTNSLGHGLIDQIAFDPTGNFLFLSGWGDQTLVVLRRDGTVAKVVPMAHQPDGISFHASNPKFVATNNTDGTLSRFDFPANDFSQTPVESLLGSGAGYGDHTGVGPDGCWYVSNDATKYADGTSGGTGLVRVCGGFAPPIGVSTITLSPLSQSAPAGTTANVTATVVDSSSNPLPGANVTATVLSGPDAGKVASGTTGAAGTVALGITNTGTTGTDTVHATFVDGLGNTQVSNVVSIAFSRVSNRPTTCVVSALRPGPPAQQDVTVKDPDGIASIYNLHITNGTVSVPAYTPGTPGPVVLTATKSVQSQRTFWEFDVRDSKGAVKHCV